MSLLTWPGRSILVLVLLFTVACSGPSPTMPPTGTTTTTVPAGPLPTPPIVAGCPLGYGSGRFTCQGDIPGLVPDLQAAIDKLVQERPQLFSLENPPAVGAYLVYDVDAFYDGVIANLVAAGLCAEANPADRASGRIKIKEDNSWSENFDFLSGQSRIRSPLKYLNSCTPANFPLNPDNAVARVAVSFFRINCPQGGTPPHNAFRQLPLGCVGTITATPLDAQGNKLLLEVHGSEVSWFFREGEGTVVAPSPIEDEPFNMRLYPRELGGFSICATVKGVTGCLNGEVVPAL